MSVFNKIISFFCGDNIDKIRIRESTVMRNNQVHKLHKEIIDQLFEYHDILPIPASSPNDPSSFKDINSIPESHGTVFYLNIIL